MNKVYKVIWSKTRHCYVVTSELAKRQGKSCGARTLRRSAVTLGVTGWVGKQRGVSANLQATWTF